MRSKLTNMLQISVLVTAAFYLILGLTLFIVPYYFGKVLLIDIPEEWVKSLFDQFHIFLYVAANSFAILVFVSGLSMVLPLFDPLKYRGLIYFNGVFFPLLMLVFLGYGYYIDNFKGSMHVLVFIIIFSAIFIFNYLCLTITRHEAKKGIE